jgi:RNA polymerase sigma factor (sigma-70 family)
VEDPGAEADELTVEVFLQLWRSMHTFSSEKGTVRGLLHTILARQVSSFLWERRRRRRMTLSLQSEVSDADGFDEGFVDMERAWREHNLTRVLLALKHEEPECYQLLHLRYVEAQSFRQVAQVAGKSLAAARQWDIRTRVALFRQGWQYIREHELSAGNRLRVHRATRVADLIRILQEDDAVAPLFEEYFGASSWRLIKPRRRADHDG